ncbi:hypothetical protein CEXT_241431 [Caerostris extrusa]|uniref:Uncharacterized protein n=1 Tax=Caerostris extrusa TaxID=172846 RepID=A0AAV4TI84_CAEEX|nr:hypothetical protein CEXT_241431 [Caerostris extrusa]
METFPQRHRNGSLCVSRGAWKEIECVPSAPNGPVFRRTCSERLKTPQKQDRFRKTPPFNRPSMDAK